MSDLDDNMVLNVIETSAGDKGQLVDANGAYSGNIPKDIIDKLRIVRWTKLLHGPIFPK